MKTVLNGARRLLTGLLAAAMIITSIPQVAFATELDADAIDNVAVTDVSDATDDESIEAAETGETIESAEDAGIDEESIAEETGEEAADEKMSESVAEIPEAEDVELQGEDDPAPAPMAKVTFYTDRSNTISAVTYYEMVRSDPEDDSSAWVTDGEEKIADVSGGRTEKEIASGRAVKITGWTYDESSDYGKTVVVNRIKWTPTQQATVYEISPDEDGCYLTGSFSSELTTDIGMCGYIMFDCAMLESDKIKVADGQIGLADGAEPIPAEGSTTRIETEGKDYVNREDGYTFTLEPAAGIELQKVYYTIGEDDPKAAVKGESGGDVTWTIPEEDVIKGILTGGISISVSWMPVEISVTEAKDSDETALTKTTITADDVIIETESGKTCVDGYNDVTFTVDYAEGLTDYDVTLGRPTVSFTPDGADAATVAASAEELTYDAETGIYTIAKGFILKAMDAGAAITIAAQAERDDSIDSFTFTLNSEDIVSLTFEEYESKAAYDTNFNDWGYKSELDTNNKPREYVIKPVKIHTISSEDPGWTAGSDGTPTTVTGRFKSGNYVVLSKIGFTSGSKDIDYIKVETGSTEIAERQYYDPDTYKVEDDYELGVPASNSAYSISTARLPKSSIKFEGDLEDTDERKAHVVPSIYSQYVSGEYILARMPENVAGIVTDISYIYNSDPLKNYKVKTPITYKISTTGDKVYSGKSFLSSGVNIYILKEDLKKAAFEGATVTVNIELEENGYRKQNLYLDYFNNSSYKIKTVVKVNGGSLGDPSDYSNSNFFSGPSKYAQISYGKQASVELTAKTGYDLGEVLLIPDDIYAAKCKEFNTGTYTSYEYQKDELKTWVTENAALPDSDKDKVVKSFKATDGKVTIDIESMDKPYRVLAVAVNDYDLVIRGTNSDEVVADGASLDVPYCSALYFAVVSESGSEVVDASKITLTATVPDTSKGTAKDAVIDVTDKVLLPNEDGARIFGFSGMDESVHGKTVTLKVVSKTLIGGDGEDKDKPVYSYTIYLKISKPVTSAMVAFPDDLKEMEYVIGKPVTITLNTGKGFNKDCYEVKTTPANRMTVTKSEDGKKLTLYYAPNNSLYVDSVDISLVEKDNHNVVISGPITVKRKIVVPNADISAIKATSGANTIRLDFTGVNGDDSTAKFDPNTDYLFWLVNAEKVGEGNPEFKDKIENKLIPVKTGQYDLVLSDDEAVIASEPVEYNVTVKLAQCKSNSTSYSESNLVGGKDMVSTTPFTTKVSTLTEATYATKISFEKSKSMPKKIYSTMGKIEIGTVRFADISKGKKPTEQRLSKVEVQDMAGNVLASAENNSSVISMDNNVISFSPYNFGNTKAGKYNIVAYAVEPKGKEVTCKQTISILQGICSIRVVTPSTKIYKQANKALNIKLDTEFYPANAANKKVNYILCSRPSGGWSYSPLSYPGITIKNGVLKIDKNAKIPDEGFDLMIKAEAADYEGNGCYTYSNQFVIAQSGIEEAPVYIIVNTTEIKEGESYYSSVFSTEDQRIYAYDRDMKDLKNFGTKAAGLTTVKNGSYTYFRATKPVIKKASLTITPTDSAALKPLKVNFKIKSDTNMSVDLKDSAGQSILVKGEGDDYTAVNSYAAGKYMTLIIKGEHDALIDHSVKFTGIKKVSSDNGRGEATVYVLNPTASTGKIEITDKADGNKKITIALTNDKVASVKTATKVTASNMYDASYNSKKKEVVQKDNKGKIFNALYYADAGTYAVAGSFNKVTYSVKTGSKAAEGTVLISTSSDIIAAVLEANGAAKAGAGAYTMALAEGKFTIDYSGYDSEGTKDRNGDGVNDLFYIPAGKYSFTVTPIDDQGKASAKTASVTVTAAAAPKAKVVVAATTINKFESEAPIGFKTMNNIVFNGNDTSACYTGNRLGINTAGVINKFATVFSTNLIQGMLVCIKSPEKYDAAYTKKPAAGMSGWIEYGWTNLDGSKGSAYVKITVKPDKNGKIVQKPSA